MRMDDQDESQNVEDVRGSGGGGFRPIHGVGLGTIVVALIGGWALGINPLTILGLLSGGSAPSVQTAPSQPSAAPGVEDPQKKFISQILRSTEQVWTDAFQERGMTYEDPKLRLYTGEEPTACGMGQAAMGPFYCPN